MINEYHYYLLCENLYAIYSIQLSERKKIMKYYIHIMFVGLRVALACLCLPRVSIVWYFRFTKHFTVFYLRLLVKRCNIIPYNRVCLCMCVWAEYMLHIIKMKATVILIKHERVEIRLRVSNISTNHMARAAAFNEISSN